MARPDYLRLIYVRYQAEGLSLLDKKIALKAFRRKLRSPSVYIEWPEDFSLTQYINFVVMNAEDPNYIINIFSLSPLEEKLLDRNIQIDNDWIKLYWDIGIRFRGL